MSQRIGDYPILKYLGSANIGKIEPDPDYFHPKSKPQVKGTLSFIGILLVVVIGSGTNQTKPQVEAAPPAPATILPAIVVVVVGIVSVYFVRFSYKWLRRKVPRGVKESKVSLFISEIISLNKMASDLHLAPAVEQALTQKVEFYRVSLVADFYPAKNSKFVFGKINVELASPSTTADSVAPPTIYSIAPLKANSETKITTKYTVDPEFKLTEASILLGSVSQEKEYRKLHPYIIGHFGKQSASWEFRTTNTIDNIEGVQFLEFTVRQPANMKSDWQALPEGELNWRGRGQRFKAAITHDAHPLPKNKLEQFSVPLN